MEIRKRAEQAPFTTKDGSTIRSLLDLSNAPVKNQSLAEATLPAGGETERHYHKLSEEFYYLLSGWRSMARKERLVRAIASSSPPEPGIRSERRKRCNSSAAAPRLMRMRILILSSWNSGWRDRQSLDALTGPSLINRSISGTRASAMMA